jgi:hypothetical protein
MRGRHLVRYAAQKSTALLIQAAEDSAQAP